MGGPTETQRPLQASFVGTIAYAEANVLQERLRAAVLDGTGSDVLLLLEHPSVFTLGRNADAADVRAGLSWLEQRGVEVAATDRGGQVTYHGPGSWSAIRSST